MTPEQLQAIEAAGERNQGRNDGMIRQDVMDLIAEVRRLRLAEKVCKLMQKNRGGHYCVVSKCDNCHTEEVGNAGEVCWTCIDKALKEWEAAGNG